MSPVRLARQRRDPSGQKVTVCLFDGEPALWDEWLEWLGEQGDAASVQAAVGLSVPFDLKLCAHALDASDAMAFVYRTRFLRTLKRKALEKADRFPQPVD